MSLRDTLIQLGYVSAAAAAVIAVRALFVVRRTRKSVNVKPKAKAKAKPARDRRT